VERSVPFGFPPGKPIFPFKWKALKDIGLDQFDARLLVLGVLCGLRVFSNLAVFGVRFLSTINDGGFSDFSAQCILRFSGFAKEATPWRVTVKP